jgi:Trypsin-like peptidase domain/Effector-associated domain 1
MSVLDKVPQDWTRPELPELRDLFVLAFRTPTSAQQIADEAGIVPGTFPHHPTMRTTWTELVRVMGNQKKLSALVMKAADDPGAAAYRPRFMEMLGGAPAVTTMPPAPAGSWWKGDDAAPAVAARLFPQRLMERRSRLMKIGLANQVTQAAPSVAKLSLRFANQIAHGTGFLISGTAILTNHHNVVHPDYGNVASVVAEFDCEEGFKGEALVRKGRIDAIVGAADHDWAVIPLGAPVERSALKLGTPFDIGIDDTVVIIQHPKGAYKQFSLEPLAIRFADEGRIQYVADTQQGSSGSPVFNDRMHVVALHHVEAEMTVKVDGKAETVWRNQGVHIGKVMQALKERGIDFSVNT